MARDRLTIRRVARSAALKSVVIASLAAGAAAIAPVPALAQSQDEEARLRKIEAEVRALQREVFPGGDGRFFSPEVITPQGGAQQPAGTPATSAVSDILLRLDALEQQLARLTAREEETGNELSEMKKRIAALEVVDTNAVNPQAAVAGATGTATAAVTPTPTPAPAPSAPAPAAAAPSPERIAAVSAIPKPDTGDAGEDEYVYGFRLWEAEFYPEAQQQLRKYVEDYPNHARISFGRNLLGRAFLDAGQAREAASWFLQNYQADKSGARAGDSLLFLSEAMIEMKDNDRACIALAEFGETYPALAAGRLKDQYERDRSRVTCK